MAHNWKPGDVALVEAGCWANRKVALRLDEGWAHANGVNVDGDGIVTPVRPLVTIDPEDREQVRSLLETYGRQFSAWTPELDSNVTRLQAALREFANPKPAKPEEPTGLGAVVEDAKGRLWFRMTLENQTYPGEVWQERYSEADRWSQWSDIDVVRVLSEGVS